MKLFFGGRSCLAIAQAVCRFVLLTLLTLTAFGRILAQIPKAPPLASAAPTALPRTSSAFEVASAPNAPAPAAAPAASFTKNSNQAVINGRPYVRLSRKDQFEDYLRDTYGLPALAQTLARATFAQGLGKPTGWGQDWTGFGQRFGSSTAVTVIDGNTRYAMETVFREDMRYIPCHGCSIHRKIENALMAEITARHDSDGHRFFTLTPLISDMTGPIIANGNWVPGHSAIDGVVGTRTVLVARIGGHLFREFVLELRHTDPKLPD